MAYSYRVFIVFLVISSYALSNAILPNFTEPTERISTTTTVQPTPVIPTSNTTEKNSHEPQTNIWLYIGICIGVVVLIVITQSICFAIYIRRLKSSQSPRAQECLGDIKTRSIEKTKTSNSGAPEPPPTSTLPKRNRSPLPLPDDVLGPKSSTLTPQSTQELLQKRGRQVSTVPNQLHLNYNAHSPMSSRSPQQRRLPTPVPTPVLKPRDISREERSYMIYESLPDLRENRHLQKPPPHTPAVNTPQSKVTAPKMNKMANLPAHRANLIRQTPSPVMSYKPQMPLPQECHRNCYPTKPNQNITTNRNSVSIYESLPDIRDFKNHHKAPLAPPPVNKPRRIPDTGREAISNELMEKLKRRANLSTPSTSQITNSAGFPRKPPVQSPKCNGDDSSDDEWTIEEIKTINMYNN